MGRRLSIDRRRFLGAALAASLAGPRARAGEAGFGASDVRRMAEALAREPYRPAEGGHLRDLTYDQYRRIHFDPVHSLWRDEALFNLQFFHTGFFFDRPVAMSLIEEGAARPLAYAPEMFQFRGLEAPGPDAGGYAGFRATYPLNMRGASDEVIAFLGASYFRFLGRNQRYGLSARGIAVDTAGPDGEEFPDFRAFWIEKPPPDGGELVVHALLDGPSLTGAYRFALRPRTVSALSVEATLFPRREIAKLGVAPLTSMFLFGENGPRGRFDDFRPEVHDSDGLMVETGGGEWIWRPLVNRRHLTVSSFHTTNPRGFGLSQRDNAFVSYQDLEARYDLRPSYWVRPVGDWGPGRVELVEIPSDEETNDNIVAYWVSERPVTPDRPLSFAYRIHAARAPRAWPPGAKVAATRIGTAKRPGARTETAEAARLFVIDWEGGDLPFLEAGQPIEAVLETSAGTLSEPIVQHNPATRGWRVFFDYAPHGDGAADIRCFLRLREHVLSETWSYLWTP